jgi:hypothetical protein
MDQIRRTILRTGAAAATMAAAPRVFAQQTEQGAAKFYEKGPVRVAYQEAGSGFPLLLIAGGGLNSRMAGLATSPFMYPWKEPRERIPLAVRQIRSFLRAHRPASA